MSYVDCRCTVVTQVSSIFWPQTSRRVPSTL